MLTCPEVTHKFNAVWGKKRGGGFRSVFLVFNGTKSFKNSYGRINVREE